MFGLLAAGLLLAGGGPPTGPELRLLGSKPRAPGKVRVDRVSESSVTLKWRDRARGERRYEMRHRPQGGDGCITGSTDARWDDDLNQLKDVPGTAFEVVDTGGPIRPAGAPCAG